MYNEIFRSVQKVVVVCGGVGLHHPPPTPQAPGPLSLAPRLYAWPCASASRACLCTVGPSVHGKHVRSCRLPPLCRTPANQRGFYFCYPERRIRLVAPSSDPPLSVPPSEQGRVDEDFPPWCLERMLVCPGAPPTAD